MKENNKNIAENHNAESPSPDMQLHPVKKKIGKSFALGGKIILGGTVVAFLASIFMPTRTMGATRSARLKWQQRQADIEKLIEEQTAEKNSEKFEDQQQDTINKPDK